ncbi:MAG: hypothetical protein V4616_10090 [Bacteroidota bacterium]
MEEEEITQAPAYDPSTRPSGFGILLVLSWINTIFWTIINFVLYLFCSGLKEEGGKEFFEQLEKSLSEFKYSEEQIAVAQQMFVKGPELFGGALLASIATIVALVQLSRGRKLGFHLYTAARIFEVFLPPLVAGAAFLSIPTFIFSGVFCYFFYRYSKDFA